LALHVASPSSLQRAVHDSMVGTGASPGETPPTLSAAPFVGSSSVPRQPGNVAAAPTPTTSSPANRERLERAFRIANPLVSHESKWGAVGCGRWECARGADKIRRVWRSSLLRVYVAHITGAARACIPL
jgi:hypothetical protein